jgi:MerR family mercuric resistance operon transcriptional regulator
MEKERFYTISEIAKQCEINVQTLRYYEKRGLIIPLKRSRAGYRLYKIESKNDVFFIKEAQGLGFTLSEIEDLLSIRAKKENFCNNSKTKANLKLLEVREKITLLKEIEMKLLEAIANCEENGNISECPMIESMEKGNKYE